MMTSPLPGRTLPTMIDDPETVPGQTPAPVSPVTTRDWIRGILVVVGVTVVGVGGAIWVLANLVFGSCCTRPPTGI